MSDPISTPAAPPIAPKREFDQILSGDVKIKKLCNSDDEYKITFSKNKKHISKMLIYQVWSDSNTPEGKKLNENREVYEMNAKDWVKMAFPKPPPAVPFAPTTVMEHGNKKYVFVINDAKVNANGHVVFYVSSKYIDPNSTNKIIKNLKKIPQGKFHNARFDFDDTSWNDWYTWTSNPSGVNSGSSFYCHLAITNLCPNAPFCSNQIVKLECNNYYPYS